MVREDGGAQGQARLKRLQGRIELWRRTRTKRSPMPAELWRAATELVQEFGAYRVARELRVGYGSLKDRLDATGENEARAVGGFIELDGASLFSGAPAGARSEVELSDARGTKMVIRLAAGQAVDVGALLAAFREATT